MHYELGFKIKARLVKSVKQRETIFFFITRNVNNISQVRRSTIKRYLKKKNKLRKHAECQSSRMKKDERAVQDIETCLEEFEAKPFEASNSVFAYT